MRGGVWIEAAVGGGQEEAEVGVEPSLEDVDEKLLGDPLADASLLHVVQPKELDAQRRAQLQAHATQRAVRVLQQVLAAHRDGVRRLPDQQCVPALLAVVRKPPAQHAQPRLKRERKGHAQQK